MKQIIIRDTFTDQHVPMSRFKLPNTATS